MITCELYPFVYHKLILLYNVYITTLDVKFLCHHGSACDVMCCACAISPLGQVSILPYTAIRCSSSEPQWLRCFPIFYDVSCWTQAGISWSKLLLLLHFMVGHEKVTWPATLGVAQGLAVSENWLVASELKTQMHKEGWFGESKKRSKFSIWAVLSQCSCQEL